MMGAVAVDHRCQPSRVPIVETGALMKSWIAIAVCAAASSAAAGSTVGIACSLAPSQSKAAAAAVTSMGGAGAATAAVGQALGLAVVTHSSGAAILTGTGGYVAGTLGAAAAAPVIVTLGIVAVTGATALELVCAPRNHPEQVAKIAAASKRAVVNFKDGVRDARSAAGPRIEATRLKIQRVNGDVFAYAFRRPKMPIRSASTPALATPTLLPE